MSADENAPKPEESEWASKAKTAAGHLLLNPKHRPERDYWREKTTQYLVEAARRMSEAQEIVRLLDRALEIDAKGGL